jgi:endonuclease/exonuclease/phosphatase family metal-dependent hydrolase
VKTIVYDFTSMQFYPMLIARTSFNPKEKIVNSTDIKVVSYNILNDWHGVNWNTPEGYRTATQEEIEKLKISHPDITIKDGRVSNWQERLPRIVNNLLASSFSLACLQEVNPLSYKELQERFNSKNIQLLPLSLCKAGQSEKDVQKTGVAIAYRDEFEVLGCEVFQSPAESEWPRGAIYADFLHKTTGKIIRVAGVHLKGYDPTIYNKEIQEDKWNAKQSCKKQGYDELQGVLKKMQVDAERPDITIIAGDFNDDRNAEYDLPHSRHKLLEANGYHYVPHGETEHRTGREIDYTYFKKRENVSIIVEPYRVSQDVTASDHVLIGTVIKT